MIFLFLLLFFSNLFSETITELINKGEYSKALIKIDEEIDRKTSLHWSLKGIIMLNQKKYNEAISYFEKAKKLDPSDVNLYYLLGMLYENIGGKEGKAIENFEKFVQISKDKKRIKLAKKHLKKLKSK